MSNDDEAERLRQLAYIAHQTRLSTLASVFFAGLLLGVVLSLAVVLVLS